MHYSLAQRPKELLEWSNNMAMDIQTKQADGFILHPVLVYRGMSGVAAATAISLALFQLSIDHDMFYIRKDHERSHGSKFSHSTGAIESDECTLEVEQCTFIFVDDFVASGTTWRECQKVIELYWQEISFRWFALQEPNGSDERYTELRSPIWYI